MIIPLGTTMQILKAWAENGFPPIECSLCMYMHVDMFNCFLQLSLPAKRLFKLWPVSIKFGRDYGSQSYRFYGNRSREEWFPPFVKSPMCLMNTKISGPQLGFLFWVDFHVFYKTQTTNLKLLYILSICHISPILILWCL